MNTVISGSAVFRKDKLVGWLDDAETRGALWLRNELKTSVVTVEISKDKGGGNISAMAVRKATKIKPILRDRKLRIQGDIYMENTVYENNSSLDMSDPKIIQYVEQELELETKRRIQSTIEKAQKHLIRTSSGSATLYTGHTRKRGIGSLKKAGMTFSPNWKWTLSLMRRWSAPV